MFLGASAGTHIATANIKHVENFDENNVKIKDYNGLNIYKGIIICHYNDARKNILKELKKQNLYEVETLNDDEILYKDNNKWVKL